MGTKWLISINPSPSTPDGSRTVTELHGPFESREETQAKAGEIASDLCYPDDLVFAAFEVIDGNQVILLD